MKKLFLGETKRTAIRAAGLRTEKKFFGKRGIFAKSGHSKHLKNPGAKWHEGMADAARRYGNDALDKLEKALAKGMEVAHSDSAGAARRLHMNEPERKKGFGYRAAAIISGKREESDLFRTHKEATDWLKGLQREGFNLGIAGVYREMLPKRRTGITRKRRVTPERVSRSARWFAKRKSTGTKRGITRNNPLAIFGFANPPKQVNCDIAGVIYNICHEVRAEKTGYKRGLYRHPFSKKSGVQVLALDNGDLLLHSTAGERLWKRS